MSALNVLIFEADRGFAASLTRAFQRRKCSVAVVEDGQAGLDRAQSSPPDLIILSIELPRMNGFAVCNRLKKNDDLKNVPLIIVSSESPQETFEQHSKLRTRAEDYAHKPSVIFHDGMLYHFYCAVSGKYPNDVRGVSVARSKPW